MLRITIPAMEFFDEEKEEFIHTKEYSLRLEHSLISISKWESKWNKPFLSNKKKDEKTYEEVLDYIRCMTITQNIPEEVYRFIRKEDFERIREYIEAPMSATVINTVGQKGSDRNREPTTSEMIYFSMVNFNIPFECQKWHLNRLINLISICTIKNQPPKKMSKREILQRNRAINQSRQASLNTKG